VKFTGFFVALIDFVVSQLGIWLYIADHVFGVKPLVSCLQVELHGLSLPKGLETVPLDLAVMDENVVLNFVLCDESKTFCVVEPFHESAGHTAPPDNFRDQHAPPRVVERAPLREQSICLF